MSFLIYFSFIVHFKYNYEYFTSCIQNINPLGYYHNFQPFKLYQY